MRVVGRSPNRIPHVSLACMRATPGGGFLPAGYEVQAEHVLRILVDGEPEASLSCTPDHIVELVVGRLFTEGVVDGVGEIGEVRLCGRGDRVLVRLQDRASARPRPEPRDAGRPDAGGGFPGGPPAADGALPALDPVEWRAGDIFALARAFEGDAPMHRRTHGTHSCYLARGGEVLYRREDLGRHNAFDKVVGRALIDGVDLRTCTAFTSGRIPADMAAKAIRARIPVMASKAVPTDLAVELARRHGLTLLCSAHSDSFLVFNDPRCAGEADAT